MTENEAYYIFDEAKQLDDSLYQYNKNYLMALDLGIKALEEIQQYRTLGTVKECRSAVEKQGAKKPKDRYKTTHIWDGAYCPVCGCGITARWSFCQNCGQAIDWSDSS